MKREEESSGGMVLESMTRSVRIPVGEANIFTFPDGVPAFEEYNKFVLSFNEDVKPFFMMKSVGISPEISFVCIDPTLICPDYKIKVGPSDVQVLELKNAGEAFVFSLVTVRDKPSDITANLQGPVVLNLKNFRGRQIICDGSKYDVRYRIWDAIRNVEKTLVIAEEPATVACCQ